MVKVVLWGSLSRLVDGKKEVNVEADNLYQLLQVLGREYPALRKPIKKGVAISLNGTIYRQDWTQKIEPDSEVFLLPPMAGG